MNIARWLSIAGLAFISICCHSNAQTAPPNVEPELVQQAQTLSIPLTAIAQPTAAPVKDLKASDFSLDVDGHPQSFQLSRPWTGIINPKTGQPEDRPNLLIILPHGIPLDREEVLEKAVTDLSQQPELGWNISILDDAGNQTHYTCNLKTAVARLKTIENRGHGRISLADWRSTATIAIASMRDLPGRRVVMTLGDIFHEVLLDRGQLVYEAFQVDDVADGARNSGVTIYAAESTGDLEALHGLSNYFSVIGTGPWLLLTKDGHVAGWISNSVADTMDDIRRDGMGAYDIDLHLNPKQMDGQLHPVSLTSTRPQMILNAPSYYVAPELARLRQLAGIPSVLRQTLQTPSRPRSSPLQMATQLAYFPHRDGKTGTQIATTGFFWNSDTPPPTRLDTALKLEQTSSGYIENTTVGQLDWSSDMPVWNTALNVIPGVYTLRVAAATTDGKVVAAVDTPFSIESTADDQVMISSVALGKSCVFSPPPAGTGTPANSVDYLRAGNCELRPDPTHQFSPQDIVWTLARITPVGKLSNRPSKDWKASFELIDADGSKRAQEPVHWLPAQDGSFVATAAFPLNDPKLKLMDGEYAIVFQLKGPGIESGYGEDAPFTVYGAAPASAKR